MLPVIADDLPAERIPATFSRFDFRLFYEGLMERRERMDVEDSVTGHPGIPWATSDDRSISTEGVQSGRTLVNLTAISKPP